MEEKTVPLVKLLPRSSSSSGSFKMDSSLGAMLPSFPLLTSFKEMEKELEQLQWLLQGKETEMNWEKKEEGLKRLRMLIKHHSLGKEDKNLDECISQGIRNCIEDVLSCTTSLRTTLSMTALVTMEEILLSFAPILDPMSDILLVALLKSLSSTKKMIHVAASQTILMLLQKCYLKSRIIEKIVSCVDDKNVQIRIYAIQFIQCIVEIDPHKCSDVILNALKKGITNAHPQVRESSRQCYYALVHMNKWKSEIFLNMLDIATRKVLSKGDKPPTFQSVLTSPPNLIGSSTSQATTAIASTTPPPPSNTSKLLVSNLPNGSHDTMSMSDSLTLMHRKNDKMKSPIKDREGSPKKGVHGSMSHTASFSTSHTKLLSSMDPPSPTPFFISAVDTFVLDPVDLPSYLTLYQCSRRPMVSKMDMDVFVQAFHQPSIQVMAMACFVYSVQLHGFPSSFLPSFPSIWFKYLDEPGEVGFWAHEGLLEVTQRHPILMNDLILHQPFIPVHFGVLHGIQEEAWNVLGQSIGEGCTHRDIHQRYRATQCLAELLNSHPHWITSWIDKGCILDQHVEKAQRWIDWGKKKAMVEFT